MKNLIVFLTIIVSNVCYSQTCDCNNASQSQLLSIYQKYSDDGLKITDEGQDLVVYIIDRLSFGETRQLCIDSWALINENDTNYTYERFKRINKVNIKKEDYLKYPCYFEMISIIRQMIINYRYK